MASNATYQKTAKFLMLPMDEKHDVNAGCFYVDLNTREIKIPTMYTKYGVSVTGDQLAETLMFKVPRYFDYTDLASTEIYVQWTNLDGKEGASRIVLVDYESEEGYILFGWPLTSNITTPTGDQVSNSIKFSIRFFVRDQDKNIKYSLNTLPASVMIKQALYTNFNNDLPIDDPSLLFAQAVLNGIDTNMVLPKVPSFFADWVLPSSISLVDDTATMYVQGAAPDNGMILYRWTYYPRYIENNVVVTPDFEEPHEILASESVPMITKHDVPQEGRTYYVQDGSSYVIFDGAEFDPEKTYYEMVCEYEIFNKSTSVEDVLPPNKKHWPHVTGEYQVTIGNKIGSAVASGETILKCKIPCIEEVNFTTDLEPNAILLPSSEEENAVKRALLTVGVTLKDDVGINNDAIPSFEWYRADSSTSEYVKLDNASSSSLTVENIGWYKVKAFGTLNREVMTKECTPCKVTYPVEAPKILNYYIDDNKYISNLDGVIESVPGLNTPITFRIEIDELDEFKTDGVKYTWYRNTPNSNKQEVSVNDLDIDNINGNEITVRLLHNSALPVDIAFYYCEITNTLAGEEETTISEVFQIS